MDQITCKCPHCKAEFNTQPEWIGKNTNCPSCGQLFMIQEQASKEESPSIPNKVGHKHSKLSYLAVGMGILLLFCICVITILFVPHHTKNWAVPNDLSAESVSLQSIKKILPPAYEAEIKDIDGGYLLLKVGKVKIAIQDKQTMTQNALRFISSVKYSDIDKALASVNKFNQNMNFLKAAVHTDVGVIVFDYYLFYSGGLSEKNLIKTIDYFALMIISWELDI